MLGLIEIPASMNRVVEIPSPTGTYSYILLEDVILACLDSCFGSYKPLDRALIRVTRNADIDPDGEGVEEEEDYRQHMKRILKKRLRLQPVVLAVSGSLEKATLKTIRKALELSRRSVFTCDIPLDLGYVFGIEGKIPEHLRNELLFTPFKPQPNPTIDMTRSIREQVLQHDKLLFYPYEAMNPFLDLVHEAAYDPECISLRITLYRVAKQSRLCESLIDAAENGKEVTVLMELRARFDEQNNIEWAERLEEAGCTVIYGSEGFKCHSKICQLTYREGMALTRLTLLGTGNFNEKTAKLYSDFMLMTAHPGIGEDANLFFRNLSLGNLRGDYRFLGVAPVGLKPLIMRGLDREIQRALAGEPARVFFKLNSLTDREVIDKIAEASCAGVRVDMIIRGISCLKSGRSWQDRERACPFYRRTLFGACARLRLWRGLGHDLSELGRHDDAQHRAPRGDRLPRARPHLPRPGTRVHGYAAAGQREGPQPHERRHLGSRGTCRGRETLQLAGSPAGACLSQRRGRARARH